jgi:isocitrate dehydrogenase
VLSDVAAQIAGSVGMAGSANIGEHAAMFEAIHGSAPRRAGQNLANPSGLLQGGIMMMVHIGQPDVAERVHNAWLRTIEEGIHTYDIFRDNVSREKVGTKEFADAVIKRFGKNPEVLEPVSYASGGGVPAATPVAPGKRSEKVLLGADVFLDWDRPGRDPEELGTELSKAGTEELPLTMITNRGLKVWPKGAPETFCTDHWRCRFGAGEDRKPVDQGRIIELLEKVHKHGFEIIKTEHLYTFDGDPGFSLGQGQ